MKMWHSSFALGISVYLSIGLFVADCIYIVGLSARTYVVDRL